ncbi:MULTISPECIES: magnesium transporter MgtE N-terminal domain-containing protein [Intrasporangiaceae]|jgi:CBS domain-containing protein/sporulation protein YlmC with PRC-barrel domain|uniref:magnesium transporter MgtE N-terminal domain-containing protein n=1 Tax=Intrasporangiaceae TaxID=85021 RepID=UPI0003609A9A|nr:MULTISPECIES: CBS domain-containing protein [Intrasporangiaceae]KRC91863.1 magnesium transporter [Terrabacter sp. Root85]KRF48543.1 magnesium transporter [Terrabacter sp. Soil811]
MSASTRVFVARLTGLSVFDPLGDQVGRVRDVVVMFSVNRPEPRVIGLVVEVPGRRRVFVPMTRVTSIDAGAVITTGLVNMRRFEQRTNEVLVAAELFDRTVRVTTAEAVEAGFADSLVEDLAIEQGPRRDWIGTRVFVRQAPAGVSSASKAMSRLTRRRSGKTMLVDIRDVVGLHEQAGAQSAERLLETYDDLKVADLAEVIHDLNPKRRAEVAAALDDERLADVLEELPEDDQVEILAGLANERAADVLEAMEPDDAADLLADLPPEQAEELLQLMEPDEAAPLRRLLAYDEKTAGGMMTTEPVILGPEATIAEALATVRREELAPALASMVYVCRPPLEAPTGRYLGLVHIQRLLREPPHGAVGSIIDKEIEPVVATASLETVTRTLATYNLVSLPVVDDDGRLIGAVTVDDVLDHILPEDWREERHELGVKP